MTNRKKLIELLYQKQHQLIESGEPFALESYADYLLENGVIVPPCKVDDTVYIITTKHPCYACHFCTDFCHKDCRIDDKTKLVAKRARVFSIELGAINKISAKIEETKIANAYNYSFWFEDFGETVFFTREEAEKALAERAGNK